jgi:Protein of unknown function (DUF4239)
MSYVQALMVVIICGLGAVTLSYLVHRLVKVETRVRHQEVGTAVFLQLGVLYAVLLAFVFSEAFGQYAQAQQAVDQERAALHGAAMLASTLPTSQARWILGLETHYIGDVLHLDWPDMSRLRKGNEATESALITLIQQVARLPPDKTDGPSPKAQLLSLLSAAHAESTVRLYSAESGLPLALWVILAGFSLVLMAFVALSGVRCFFLLALFSVTFATCISSILILVRLLEYPFEGAIGISPASFSETLSKVIELLHSV